MRLHYLFMPLLVLVLSFFSCSGFSGDGIYTGTGWEYLIEVEGRQLETGERTLKKTLA